MLMSPVTSRGYDGEAVRTPSRPAEVNVLVAVAPKYALLAEKRVDDANARVVSPVSVGEADMTTLPVPVMALETSPLLPSVKTA